VAGAVLTSGIAHAGVRNVPVLGRPFDSRAGGEAEREEEGEERNVHVSAYMF